MQYRRARVEGGTYFFTVNVADRSSALLVENAHLLRSVMTTVRKRHPFHVDAIVILPEHLHAIWTLPAGDNDYSTRWMLIKAGFSRGLSRKEPIPMARAKKGERNIWQRRYWEHLIRDEDDFSRHIDYIHYNPVKHGHVARVKDWPYSSFHRYAEAGFLPLDWAGGDDAGMNMGEA